MERLENIDLSEKMVLFFWSVDLHNEVNIKLKKRQWNYKEAMEKWCKKVEDGNNMKC